MHELGITRNIVGICLEHAAGARVKKVTVEIGKLSAIMPDAVRFCFDVCAKGTAVEGAEIEIIEIAGRATCRNCGANVAMTEAFGRCACGSVDLQQTAGNELNVKQMETE